ncbi:MAG TPA: hypothetical protein VKQ72_07910 [Aggregatilineales bacterium]|nr:hypothetical protein [Aggregatilineales bacterium]
MAAHQKRKILTASASALLIALSLFAAVKHVAAHRTQTQSADIQMSVEAGFNGYYRLNQWVPLLVTLSNVGPDVSGQVRVTGLDTAGLAGGEYVTDIDLPNKSSKQVFLYVTLSNVQQVNVELVTQADGVIASDSPNVQLAQPTDLLFGMITESPRGTVDVQQAHTAATTAHQVNWHVENVPDNPQGLRSLDALVLTDVDTGNLTINQRQALDGWVRAGGHLVVTGGPNWQRTQVGVAAMLPLMPNGTTTLTSLPSLAAYSGFASETLAAPQDTPIIVAQGTLQPNASVLAADGGTPLLIRHNYGQGIVDYLAVDPGIEPYASWQDRSAFWDTLLISAPQQPSWINGIVQSDSAQTAANLIAGLRLPDVAQLALFLGIYILLIGPVNYLILNRIGQRELAWLTIPLIVVASSVFAFLTGLSLRGTQATINRIALVQVWPDNDHAQVDGVIGLLAPRRSTYSLTVHDGFTLRSLTSTSSIGGLNASLGVSIDEYPDYTAQDVAVDAGLTAVFATSGTTKAIPIQGSATITLPQSQPTPLTTSPVIVSGIVHNTTGMRLQDAVVLVSGSRQDIGTLEPDASANFSINVGTNFPAAPLTLGNKPTVLTSALTIYRNGYYGTDQTVRDVLGRNYVDPNLGLTNYALGYGNTPEEQEARRRAAFIRSLAVDTDASGGRGDGVYVVGWASTSPINVDLQGAAYITEDTTMYIYRLPATMQGTGTVEVPPGLTRWSVDKDALFRHSTPYDLSVQAGQEVDLSYTPLPLASLDKVTQLTVYAQAQNSLDGTLSLWNWSDGTWEDLTTPTSSQSPYTTVSTPDRFIGPGKAVRVRVTPGSGQSLTSYTRLEVIYDGTTASSPAQGGS